MADLHALHHSWIMQKQVSCRPLDMETISISPLATEELTDVALDIFADMANAGRSFQSCVLAIYLSGLQHGSAIAQEKQNPDTLR